MLTPEAIDLFDTAVLCWLATVDANGQPSVSPKEIFALGSPHELLIADIASPRSVRNVRAQGDVCVAAVDVFEQHGYQAYGRAEVVSPGDADFTEVSRPLCEIAREKYPIRSVIRVRVDRVTRILAPSLWMYPDVDAVERRAGVLDNYGVTDA